MHVNSEILFWIDLNIYMHLIDWLEILLLDISGNTSDGDLKIAKKLEKLVWLELIHILNGLTWNFSFRYISANTCATHLKLGTHSNGKMPYFFFILFVLL